MTPPEVRSRLAGDPTFDLWDETKQQWFCGRVIDIHLAVENMKGPDTSVRLAKLKSSVRKTIAALDAFSMEVSEYLGGGDLLGGMMELRALERTTKRLLVMPRPDHMIELAGEYGYSGGDGPGGRRKWRNGVVTEMVHQLIEDAGVAIARTGKSVSRTGKAPNSEGSPSMKLLARVLDCLNPRKRRRTASTALSRVVRTKGKLTPKKTFKK
jgi:hypothetical protein